MAVGIICEYNPFHNGHMHHIKEIKKMFPKDNIVLIMSGLFTQRGDTSILSKWDKTHIALNHDVDIVVELPFVFASQGADLFSQGAIELLTQLKVDKLVFGSESNNVDMLCKIANLQINNKEFDKKVRKYMDSGVNYPTALDNATNDILGYKINTPNDILGVTYIKEIIKQNSNITPYTIQRTNNFHAVNYENNIVSATTIRTCLLENKNIINYVPNDVNDYINKTELHFINEYFGLIKYKIISEYNLEKYQTVDEGIEKRLKSKILLTNNMDDFINLVKTKRYTYNKIKRMLVHILCSFTKEEAKRCKNNQYIRILGFSNNGRKYLNSIKKETSIPIITGYSNITSEILKIELRTNYIYYMIFSKEKKNYLSELEYKNRPIMK